MAEDPTHILRGSTDFPDIKCVNVYDYITADWSQHLDDVLIVNTPDGREMKCRELVDKVDGLCVELRRVGVGYGTMLSVWCANCVDIVPLLLSAWKLRTTVALIAPSLTADEARRQIAKVKTNFLFVDKEREQKALSGNIVSDSQRTKNALLLSDQKLITLSSSSSSAGGKLDPYTDTALILFSSGTTGLPKAVELTHANLNYFLYINGPRVRGYSMRPAVHYLPLSHFYGLGMALCSLSDCALIVLLPRFNLEEYVRLIAKYRIVMMLLVPPVAVMMVQRPDLMNKYDLSCVLTVISGAAPMPLNVTEELAKYLPGLMSAVCSQGYGMTETAGTVTRTPVVLEENDPVNSIGKVVPKLQVKIIDEVTGASCRPNVHGEICVRGPIIMKGYFDDPKATAEIIDRHGWLHTGDIGRYDKRGFLFIVDRAKDLIKCRGNQVAPAELEDVLLSHSDVSDAAVVGLPDKLSGELPLAFVVLKPNRPTTQHDLQLYVTERVAPYKRLTGGVRFVSEIPKLATGKILRRQLRDSVRKQQQQHKL